ncbi:right-handed parallel beta-helix repeat-containing protein [Clostridium lacusfryxellense]|uniref:right-handed parallel beta-helix repeat-containing protein n=1 Tax=Clostridium lacusfryxellense TaxID=205328 RepID=UPI001C0B9DEC|nr:right-handed parallel beta-helix repeat-containing protein [Clostridium lacusfryxellense]MBU3114320.1 right-handed parallel beta-helix repeat-containing protein [Clostridium lacusfryxellense]
MDITGISDTSVQFQKMVDSVQSGSTLILPSGIYKFDKSVTLKDGIKLIAGNNNVTIKGIGNNTLFWTGNDNTFEGIEFQNCSTAINVLYKEGLNVISCRFINNITYAAINLYGGRNCTVKNSNFYDLHKFGVLIDKDSSNITIDNNNFENAKVFDGFSSPQLGSHIYCMNGTDISVTNNILKNSGGHGVIFGYNSTTGKGTRNSIVSNNQLEGNGQDGITIYGGNDKLSGSNSIVGNTSKNNRLNQIQVRQSDNNVVNNNTVAESATGTGDFGAICLFNTTGTSVTSNTILSSQNNGISIIAGSLNCNVSSNTISDTNRKNDVNAAEKGNGILLDWSGVADPQYITIANNTISSSNGIIAKSGIYSTSNTNHHNKVDNNIINDYKIGLHFYVRMTCESGYVDGKYVNTTDTATPIDAQSYSLDITGLTDTSTQFQNMINSYPSGSTIKLPKGIYKLSSYVRLKDGTKLIADNNVVIQGNDDNTLFATGNDNTFTGLEFQKCSTAISSSYNKGVSITDCRFTNNIKYAAINVYRGINCSITNSYFNNILKYGIKIDGDSSDFDISNNFFDNPEVFGGYADAQISAHIYCLNGDGIMVTNNTLKNSGGQGIIFGYSSASGKGTTNSEARGNHCEGNGQEGITIYGGSNKVSSNNSIIYNTSKNNRYNQIEVWQSNNNIVSNNTVEESINGVGSMGAICLFATSGTTCFENEVLSAQNNGISITAGSSNCIISNNDIANTNLRNNISTAEVGNGILLDWSGVADPQYITIENNTISSSIGTIAKSGVYSTSNTNHHNKINNNIITSYKYGVHWYALDTCDK